MTYELISLGWTDAKPTEPGWYWMRIESGYDNCGWLPRIVHVERDGRSGQLTEVSRSGRWQWAGPIPEPREGE
jgi:hypothetical protein